MDYLYFPGCTLYTKAKNFDQTARNCSLLLGFELKELPNWTCCGATFPLATDNLMALLPPSRILATARENGTALTTLCAICFNVIKRTNRLLQGDGEKRDKINNFIEKNYQGDLRVVHYLEILKEDIGFAQLKERVKKSLNGLKAAAYYGCMLLRPFEEMEFDDKERPIIFEEFLEALGAKAVDFPYKIECCGSFQSVGSPEVATECAYKILGSAIKNGAEVVVSTCPMCTFNIDHKQSDIKQKYLDFKTVPVLYFTQLLGIAMGLDYQTLGFEQNAVDPLPLLKAEGPYIMKNDGAFIKKAMVIGGGIAGISASIDLGNAGYEVVLVEKLPSIGGRMLQLSETFPTLDCAQCTLTPKTVETGQHARIKLLTYSEVDEVEGKAGDFLVRVRRKAAYVDWEKCNGCGLCQEKCPSKTPSEFDREMGLGKAIYTLSPQAVPNKPVINTATCRYFKEGKCRVCEKVCPVGAIDYEQKDRYVEERVGAIIAAVGFDLIPKDRFGEYGYGTVPDVIDGLSFERLNSASGPTTGEIRRPSDGKIPKEVVFIQCTGSRDPERYMPYCSRVCCMYTAKHARLYKHKVHDGQAYIFYMDIRSTGKGYEEFIQQGMEEEGILYLRGRVSKIFRDDGKVVIWGADTLTGKKVEVSADMVVLATAIIAQKDAKDLAKKLGIPADEYGFLTEAQRKLRPVETDREGIFIAGCAQGPKDIADAVAHANAAASKVQGLFAKHKDV